MEPLSRMIHSRLETPRMPSHIQGPSTFREPYLVANPPTVPATFIHFPDTQPSSGDTPLVATTQRFTQVEEDYLRTFWLMTLTTSDAPPAPYHPFPAAPQQQLTYLPVWPAAQSGHHPQCHRPSLHPWHHSQCPVPASPPGLPFQAPPVAQPAVPP